MRRLQTTDAYTPESSLISVDRAVTSLFCNAHSPLNRQGLLEYHVMPFGKGQVILSVVIPEGMIKPTSDLFESLHGIFKYTDMKKRHYQAQEKVFDLDEIQKRDEYKKEFSDRIVQAFDNSIESGLDKNQSISYVNKKLIQEGLATSY